MSDDIIIGPQTEGKHRGCCLAPFCNGLLALKAYALIFLLLEETVAMRGDERQKQQVKAETVQRNHFDTQALKLQHPLRSPSAQHQEGFSRLCCSPD